MFKTLLFSFLLVGVVHAKPITICAQPSDRIAIVSGCDGSLQQVPEKDPVASVFKQSQNTGPVILYPGHKSDWITTVTNFNAVIAESKKYPGKFPFVFLYDEPAWCDTGLCPWVEEDVVLQGAQIAHENGIKTLINVMPQIILHPAFTPKNINAFDVISIDVYFSAQPWIQEFGNCKYSDNYLENLFFCSVKRLREKGFTGSVMLVYQAFGVVGASDSYMNQQLTLQRELINHAEDMGAVAVMPWGLYLGPDIKSLDSKLYGLGGTKFECFVKP